MPESVTTPTGVSAQQTSISTLPGGTGISGSAPPAPAPAPFRFDETAPMWARGKTAEEVLGITQRLIEAGLKPAEQAPPPAPAPSPISLNDDDYVTGKDLRAIVAAATAGGANSLDMAASANLGILRQQYARDFQRFGPEITAKLVTVPKHMWSLDNLEMVVKLVRSDHLDELARERAQELVSTVEPTIRSTGVVGSVPVPDKNNSLESDDIPAEWKERALRQGITEEIVQEFSAANNTTREWFYGQFKKPRTAIAAEIGKVGRG